MGSITHAFTSPKADGGDATLVQPSNWNAGHNFSLTGSDVGLGSVTNDAQTKAAIVPNTAPSAGQVLAGNAGGTAYAPVSVNGDGTLSSAGALVVTKTNGASFGSLATLSSVNNGNWSGASLALGNGGTGLSVASNRALASGLAMPYIIGKSGAAASCGNDTTEDTLGTVTIPSGAMGANGFLMLWMKWTITNSANNKTLRARMDGASGTAFFSRVFTTISGYDVVMKIANANSTSAQVAAGHGNDSATNGRMEANVSGAINTASGSSITLVITGQKALNTETLTLDHFLCLLCSDGT